MGAQAAEATAPDTASQGQAENLVVKGRFVIRRSAPLPAMSSPAASAFKVDDNKGEEGALFAVLSPPNLPVRVKAIEALTGFRHPHVLRLVSTGEATASSGQVIASAAVYEHPIGGSAMANGQIHTLPDHEVRRAVIAPVCHALHALHDMHVYHRGIRPENLFYADESRLHLMIGGCVSGLPGQCQPTVFEPIERAFAPPAGRGNGGAAADMFAFGATVLAFLLGKVPCAGLSDEDLLQARIERGSYATLSGDRRFSPEIEALLGALLADNVALRWGTTEVREWLKGCWVPHIIAKSERATAPFILEDRKYWTARGVADAFNRNWDAAAPAIRSEQFERWLIRSLDAPNIADAVAARVGEASGSVYNKKIGVDEMVARTCVALDPEGPIRYKGLSVAFDGIGGLLAGAMAESNDAVLQLIGAILARCLPIAWIEARSERRTALSHVIPNYTRFARYVGSAIPGFGIERCLYELNPGLRCLSPILEGRSGTSIESILRAINSPQAAFKQSGEWIDRHIAGFLGNALRPNIDSRIAEARMPSDPTMRRTMTGLVLIATAQRIARVQAMPHLAQSMHPALSHIVNSFHSRSCRKSVESNLSRFVEKGDVSSIERLLVDQRVQRRDSDGYRLAMGRFRGAEMEIHRVQADEGARRATRAVELGQSLAARIAYVALALTITAVVMGYAK